MTLIYMMLGVPIVLGIMNLLLIWYVVRGTRKDKDVQMVHQPTITLNGNLTPEQIVKILEARMVIQTDNKI